jgi:hypothetical protein
VQDYHTDSSTVSFNTNVNYTWYTSNETTTNVLDKIIVALTGECELNNKHCDVEEMHPEGM